MRPNGAGDVQELRDCVAPLEGPTSTRGHSGGGPTTAEKYEDLAERLADLEAGARRGERGAGVRVLKP